MQLLGTRCVVLGKLVPKAMVFRPLSRRSSALSLDALAQGLSPLLDQAPDLHRTFAFAHWHHHLILTARHSCNAGQVDDVRPLKRQDTKAQRDEVACPSVFCLPARSSIELRPHGSHSQPPVPHTMKMRTSDGWDQVRPTSHLLP